MKKIRQRYDRDFKISVLTELEAGKPLAQIARKYGIHPSLPCHNYYILCRYGHHEAANRILFAFSLSSEME